MQKIVHEKSMKDVKNKMAVSWTFQKNERIAQD